MTISKIILRVKNPQTNKRQFFVSSKKLYNLINPDVSYKTFIETNITWSKLRAEFDYHYNQSFDCFNLSISAVQAILILENTEQSWKYFNELSDLIANGFSATNEKG